MKSSKFVGLVRRSLAVAALAAMTVSAQAQQNKSVVPEHVPAFPAFSQWLTSVVAAQPEAAVTQVDTVPFTLAGAASDQTYQPLPVIVGLPELPLIGAGATQAGRGWSPALNYQGLHMSVVVVRARGNKRELRPMSALLRPGEYFKIRLTATFDGVAAVDQVLGDAWHGKRTGQVYPQAGMSVQLKAGQTVFLPLGQNEYFLMDQAAERLVVSVRHAKALGDARSDQPAYRQDGKAGSNYMQLVPRGKFPALEQLVAQSQ